jgi:serine/threonine protein phosphatase 1
MGEVKFHPGRDRLFSVGDLVDRGPQSMDCLKLLRMTWFHAVRGNHEFMLMSHLENPYKVRAHDEAWLIREAPKFSDRARLAGEWLPILRRLPIVISVGDAPDRFNVVHGELIEEGRSITDATVDAWSFGDPVRAERQATEGRRLIRAWEAGRKVRRAHDESRFSPTYCGHTIVERPGKIAGQIYLDTGAFLGHTAARENLRARPTPEPDTDETGHASKTPGLVMVEHATGTAWFAATKGKGVDALSLREWEAM